MEFLDQILGLFSDFTNPKKRVFAGYLGISVLIALAWLIAANKCCVDCSGNNHLGQQERRNKAGKDAVYQEDFVIRP
ncbi:MAG: hypothetical protein AAFY09_00465, partial [Pseudomonadota bacterium]